MARKVSGKNIVGLAFIAPILVLIVFMAILSYALLYDGSGLGKATMVLVIPFLAAPALVLAILSISFTAKNGIIKWLWSIPTGTIITAILLSIAVVNYQMDSYRSKCEFYASYETTLNYLRDSSDSILEVKGNTIRNPGQDAYDIFMEAPVYKTTPHTYIMTARIAWFTSDCQIRVYYDSVICERTVTLRNTTDTFRTYYTLNIDYTERLADKLEKTILPATK